MADNPDEVRIGVVNRVERPWPGFEVKVDNITSLAHNSSIWQFENTVANKLRQWNFTIQYITLKNGSTSYD